MTDNLRDRIAEVIHRTKSPLHDHGQAQAQAIIDELHLFAEVDEDWGAMVIEGWWEKQ